MSKDTYLIQRDQKKKPVLDKLINNCNGNNLSSPFSYMDFGYSSSNLSNILQNFSRNNTNCNRSVTPISDLPEPSLYNPSDPYLKPLSLERLKSRKSEETQSNQTNKFEIGCIKSNDFIANSFLRLQSTKLENSDNSAKAVESDMHYKTKSTAPTKIMTITNRRPMSSVPKTTSMRNGATSKLFTSNNGIIDVSSSPLRPLTANGIGQNEEKQQQQLRNNNVMPVIGAEMSTRFYVKSFRNDTLIYNPEKVSEQPKSQQVSKSDPGILQAPISAQNLYQQVKKEVEQYRQQRRKEASLDVVNAPQMIPVSPEEIFKDKLNKESALKPTPNLTQNHAIELEKKNSETSVSLENLSTLMNDIRRSELNGLEKIKRPKSVTFNEKIETRDFVKYVSSTEGSSGEDSDGEGTDSVFDDDGDHGSVMSNESDSGTDQQLSMAVQNPGFIETSCQAPSEGAVSTPSIGNKDDTVMNGSDMEKSPEDRNGNHDSEGSFDNSDSEVNSDEDDEENGADKSSKTSVSNSPLDSDVVMTEAEQKPNILCNGDSGIFKPPSSSSSTCSSVSSSSSEISRSMVSSSTALSPVSVPTAASNKIKSASAVIGDRSRRKSVPEAKIRSKSLLSIRDLLGMRVYKETQLNLPLIFSKFPNVPPVLNFVTDGEKIEQLPWQLRKLLKWRTSLLTPIIVKQIITRSGFRPSRLTTAADDLESAETGDWTLYFGKHMRGPIFKTIKDYQKVNHFPGSFQLGRKDRLWRNICRMQQEVSKKEFDFIPQTFCLPTDLELFKQCWESGGNRHKWIIKPPASARGIGVKVVHKWNQIPKRRPVVVQKYISNPYLINDSKFDLRLYVFITSIDPLRIYLYEDGLVRFASTKYTNSLKSLHNRYVHLTNYSINKLNIEYLDNNDNDACKGHKWSIRSLWTYLRKRGINTEHVWHKIRELVVKTVISAEELIAVSVNSYSRSPYSVQELFGFDVILDETLKPWILEVNVSPSLHSDSPLDVIVKGGMIKDMFNISGFLLPEPSDVEESSSTSSESNNKPATDLYLDRRFWLHDSSQNEQAKQCHFLALCSAGCMQRFEPDSCGGLLPNNILDCITPGDARLLLETTDEFERRGDFERVYPVTGSSQARRYLGCFERLRYSNLLLAAFCTKHSRTQATRILEGLCQKKLHLLSAENGDKIDPKHIWRNPSNNRDN